MPASTTSFRVLSCLVWLCAGLAGCEDFDPPMEKPVETAPIPDAGRGEPPPDPPPSGGDPADDAAVQQPSGKLDFTRAQANREWIFAPNPQAGRLAVIDPNDGSTRQVVAGNRPELLVVASEGNTALILDAASTRGTVVALDRDELTSADIELGVGYNALVTSADGKYAAVYFSEAHYDPFGVPGPVSQIGLVELSVASPRVAQVSVGPRPSDVQFSLAGGTLWVTSPSGVSVVDVSDALDAATSLAPPQDFGPGHATETLELRLSTRKNRLYGFELGGSVLLARDLESGEVRSLELEDLLSNDMDAGAQGATLADVAFAEKDEQLLVLAIPELPGLCVVDADSFELVSVIPLPGQDVGKLAMFEDATTALVWSSDAERLDARLLSLDAPEVEKRVLLASPVAEVHVGGSLLVVTHAAGEGQAPGYSVITDGGAVRYQSTVEPIEQLALPANDDAPLIVGAPESADAGRMQRVDPATLVLETIDTHGRPLAVGQVSARLTDFAEVAHPDGRLVLFDWEGIEQRVFTGYRIVDRVRP